ncbi:hypothetical protein [Flavobacterium reichenbachii]|uniref:Uncharacterized protein n=1 Tax=Flavobacterium reichenbachii TaxID=362418 RepID=A0A085ZPG5_9FLAO|nr:hypothetical protein [Flavobacterium reichenbachii]KFF06329.1 hypothetical protein IW19_12700 [Flavobacterium reichenbachii]OXB17456.1 hypothetical protein B0A68_03935 [Flavobacterium reichenbachii]
MNDSLKNILNFSSTLNAQLRATEKFSNIIKIESQFSKSNESYNKLTTINSRVTEVNDLFSRYQNLAKSIDLKSEDIVSTPLKIIKSLNSGGMSQSMIALQNFVRSQQNLEKYSSSFYFLGNSKHSIFRRNSSIFRHENNFQSKWVEFDKLQFQKSFNDFEYYANLKSFAEHDILRSKLLKSQINQKIEKVLRGIPHSNTETNNFYPYLNRGRNLDFSHQQKLENFKNFIISGDFGFTYTVGLEDFLWTHFTKIDELDESINYSASKLKFLNKIIISISNSRKKDALNKRDFFRKINSFHFKNLDDEYHSFSLTA